MAVGFFNPLNLLEERNMRIYIGIHVNTMIGQKGVL